MWRPVSFAWTVFSTGAKGLEPLARKIILDCDPGHDDAIAMRSRTAADVDLVAVTTVVGNQTLER